MLPQTIKKLNAIFKSLARTDWDVTVCHPSTQRLRPAIGALEASLPAPRLTPQDLFPPGAPGKTDEHGRTHDQPRLAAA